MDSADRLPDLPDEDVCEDVGMGTAKDGGGAG